MKHRLFRSRIAAGAAVTMATLAGTLAMTAGAASASVPPDPTFGAAPQFYNGNVGAIVRSAGSDTTYYMQQSITDLYNGAALYGCNLTGSINFPCPLGANISTTDVNDNWQRTEATVGADLIGSGAGQKQLCGTVASPDPVDLARSSKPNGNICAQETIAQGYAFDGVPNVDWTGVNPAVYGAIPNTSPYFTAVHTQANEQAQNGIDGCTFTTFPSVSCDLMGPVANGWVPGNNVNGPYTGTAFTNMTNTDHGGGVNSVAFRLYCVHGGTQITDWGQLTNLGVGQVPGDGTAIGIPIDIMGINAASGTVATMSKFVNGTNSTSTECNGAGGLTDTDLNASPSHIALENNAAQIGDFLVTDHPGDPADQAGELAATFYYMSEGPLIANPNLRQVTIYSNGDPSTGTPQSYGLTKMKQNGFAASTITEGNKSFPTARALFQMALGYQAPAADNTSAKSLTVNDASVTSGSNQLTSSSAHFSQADIGRNVSDGGVDIPPGAYITAVAPGLVGGTALPANTVELSEPATTTNLTDTVTFSGHTVGLRASTAQFMNWICGTNTDGIASGVKAKDLVTGLNYDTELTNLIDNTYGFNRITDIQAGSWSGSCGLIYPVWTAHGVPGNGGTVPASGSALTDPYPGGVAVTPLPTVSSGTFNGLAGAIPFPDN